MKACVLWGARMGKSFHTAATVPDMIYGMVPYSFALALMVSVIGWFLARPKPLDRTNWETLTHLEHIPNCCR